MKMIHLLTAIGLSPGGSSTVVRRGNKNQLNAQLILGIFRKPQHVSGVSGPINKRYNRMYT
jgi:hypothetical protein